MPDADERLMAALLDWYWFEPIEGADAEPIGPPTPEAFDEMRSLIRHLDARGYRIVAESNGRGGDDG